DRALGRDRREARCADRKALPTRGKGVYSAPLHSSLPVPGSGTGYAGRADGRPVPDETSHKEIVSMPLYESVVIARQDIATTQVDTLADELTNILSEGGGKVLKRENWGLRSLTYRIKKNRKGHYVLFNIDAPPAAITEYERRMRINEDVL